MIKGTDKSHGISNKANGNSKYKAKGHSRKQDSKAIKVAKRVIKEHEGAWRELAKS